MIKARGNLNFPDRASAQGFGGRKAYISPQFTGIDLFRFRASTRKQTLVGISQDGMQTPDCPPSAAGLGSAAESGKPDDPSGYRRGRLVN
jgi:hypothetical protein